MYMTKERLKKEIIRKFKKLSKFCELSGYDRYELQMVFSRKSLDTDEIAKISHLVEVTEAIPLKTDLTEDKINSLLMALNEAGGVSVFCRKNPQFSEVSVYQIVSGRRKRITPIVQALFKSLNVN